MMLSESICEMAKKLVKKHDTRNPFEIAKEAGIKVMFDSDLNKLKGMYTIIKSNRIIIINSNLHYELQKIVCAHELGHDALHREFAKNGALKEFMLYDMQTRPEFEANTFAAEILLDDDDVSELITYGYDIEQIAMALKTDINLVGIKIGNMNTNGSNYRLPITPQGDFLKN